MNLRQLRYFMAVAEEEHFARAAERLGIEPSPLSRTIRELEANLGVQLLERSRQGTRPTWAGQVLLRDVRRIYILLEQAKCNVRAAAAGFRGTLRLALSDGIVPYRLSSLLARCQAEEPDVEICLSEVRMSEQIEGLRHDLYDVGFARSCPPAGANLTCVTVWHDPLLVILPPHHPLLTYPAIPLELLSEYPLVQWHPEALAGNHHQIQAILQAAGREPVISRYAASHDVMLALVAAGYGIGLGCHEQIALFDQSQISVRPLAGPGATLATYLLHSSNLHDQLHRFIHRVGQEAPPS